MRKQLQVERKREVLSLITDVTFASVPCWYGASRRDLKMDLIVPKNRTAHAACPAIVWICGGAYRVVNRAVWLPEMMNSSAPNIYEDAVVPSSPSSPSLIRNVAIGALLLAVAYCAFEVIRYLLNDTITSADQMEHLFGSMPLTMIPEEKTIAEEMDD